MKKYKLVLFVFIFLGLVAGSANAATATSSNCFFNNTLRLGSVGEAVACLQTRLGIPADGRFGSKTMRSVLSWQAQKGLMADGIFGAKSRANFIANGSVSRNFPVTNNGTTTNGCNGISIYNTMTGEPCSGATIEPYVSYEINGVKTIGHDQIINVVYGDPVNISWTSNGDYCEGYVYNTSSSSWNGRKSSSGFEIVKDLNPGDNGMMITCESSKYGSYPGHHIYAKDDTLKVRVTSPVSTCTNSGFDSTTGFRCGCASASGFSSVDGSSCGVSTTITAAPFIYSMTPLSAKAGDMVTIYGSNFDSNSWISIGGAPGAINTRHVTQNSYTPYSPTTSIPYASITFVVPIDMNVGMFSVLVVNRLATGDIPSSNRATLTVDPTPTPAPVCVNGFSSTTGFRCGCASALGFNSINGEPCSPTPPPAPTPISTCTAGGFDSLTGFRCGCPSTLGFNSIDGTSCAVN